MLILNVLYLEDLSFIQSQLFTTGVLSQADIYSELTFAHLIRAKGANERMSNKQMSEFPALEIFE